eukprot:scaffold93724_cov54-Phaeocystis_antarctica.AAC.3
MTEISLGLRLYVGPSPLERQLGRALLGEARRQRRVATPMSCVRCSMKSKQYTVTASACRRPCARSLRYLDLDVVLISTHWTITLATNTTAVPCPHVHARTGPTIVQQPGLPGQAARYRATTCRGRLPCAVRRCHDTRGCIRYDAYWKTQSL